MYEMQVDALPGQVEPAAQTNAPNQMSEGDFASGVRTQLAHARVAGDFGTGLRSAPNSMVVGDFATGMRALATVAGRRGDIATGLRGEAIGALRRVARSTRDHDSSRWHTPDPVGVPSRP